MNADTKLRAVKIIVAALALVAAVCIGMSSATANATAAIVVAHGDHFIFEGSDAPNYPVYNPTDGTLKTYPQSTGKGRIWIFGRSDNIYARDFITTGKNYRIFIERKEIWDLEAGSYNFLIQWPGANGVFDLDYNSLKELGCIYKSVRNVTLNGIDPKTAYTFMLQTIINNNIIDDGFLQKTISIEDPRIIVINKFEDVEGNLHIMGLTNMAAGDTLVGMIDEDKYQHVDLKEMMTNRTVAIGDDPTVYRTFEFIFKRSLATDQLPPGKHMITVRSGDLITGAISFEVGTKFVEPVPTREMIRHYSVEGNVVAYGYNKSGNISAQLTYVAPVPTPTRLPEKFNNRTIIQRDTVYEGEVGLNILQAVGWADKNAGKYRLRYENDGRNETWDFENPKNVDISPEIFHNKYGAWYQYSSELPNEDPIVAFYVARMPASETPVVAETTLVSPWGNPRPNVTREATTMPPTTVTTVVPSTIPPVGEMYPPDAMVVPLPVWVVVCAVMVAIWKRR